MVIFICWQRSETASLRPSSDALRDDHSVDPYKHHHSNSPEGNEVDRTGWVDISSSLNPQPTLVIHQNGNPESEEPPLEKSTVNPRYSESSKVNGTLNNLPGSQSGAETAGLSQFSMPSSTSLSPSRYYILPRVLHHCICAMDAKRLCLEENLI